MNFIKGGLDAVSKKVDQVKGKRNDGEGAKTRGSSNTALSRDPPSSAFAAQAAQACPSQVRMFSGCKDEQTSADVFDVSSFGLPPVSDAESAGGACTNAMLSTLKVKPSLSFGDLLVEMQAVLKKRKYTQVPQLSSSEQVNLKEEQFTLKNPNPSGRTRAVLIGINYFNQKGELKGCVNDVKMMRDFIISQGFASDKNSMRILTDDKSFTDAMPTGDNIIAAMQWLVAGAKAGDSLFFHYSGHGGQMPDDDGDEEDGMDETLIPMDYATEGQIRDDTIYQLMVAPLQKGVHMIAVFDCCHSGTILDLPYIFTANDEGVSAIGSGVSFLGANSFFNFEAAIKLVKDAAAGALRGLALGAGKAREISRGLPF